MILKRLCGLLGAVLLAGCNHTTWITPTGLDHPSGWSDQRRAAAARTWLYAQMSSNAYAGRDAEPGTVELYDLGPGVTLIDDGERNDRRIGFAYRVYRLAASPSRAAQLVIAFRGTENNAEWWRDWFLGNFSWPQNDAGLRLYRDIRDAHPRIDIATTGHSLGGGIAIQIALCHELAYTAVFNTSGHFRRCRDVEPPPNAIESVVERGEAAYVARLGREASQLYTPVDCTRRMRPSKQHSIALLANCLTIMAAWEDREALASLVRNRIEIPRGWPLPTGCTAGPFAGRCRVMEARPRP